MQHFLQKNEEKREKMSHFIQIWSSKCAVPQRVT